MPNLTIQPKWDEVPRVERTTKWIGANDLTGDIGTANAASQALANRTELLRQQQGAHATAPDPHPQYTTDAEVRALIEARVGDYVIDTGTANACKVALVPPVTAYDANTAFAFKAAAANTGAVTIDAGGGARPLVREDGTPMQAGDIAAGAVVTVVFDVATTTFRSTEMVASQVAGQIAAGMTAHRAEADPHAQYIKRAGDTMTGQLFVPSLAVGGKKMLEMPASPSVDRGPWNPIVTAVRGSGFPMFPDEEFANGTNGAVIYNNLTTSAVTMTRINCAAPPVGNVPPFGMPPNSTGQVLKFSYAAGNNVTSPGYGGFVQAFDAVENRTYVQIFQALLPVGYRFVDAQNTIGVNGQVWWLTGQEGTGKFEWYARVTHCGDSGPFSTGGHVYVIGGPNVNFDFYLASLCSFDVTDASSNSPLNLSQAPWGRQATFVGGWNGAGNWGMGAGTAPRTIVIDQVANTDPAKPTWVGATDITLMLGNKTVLDSGNFNTFMNTFMSAWGVGVVTTLNVGVGQQFPSIEAAWNSLAGKSIKTSVLIKVSDGTYNITGIFLDNHPNAEKIRIEGNPANPAACVINFVPDANKSSHGLIVRRARGLQLAGFRLTGASSATNWTYRCLRLEQGAFVWIEDGTVIVDGGCQGVQVEDMSYLMASKLSVQNCADWHVVVGNGSSASMPFLKINGRNKDTVTQVPAWINGDQLKVNPQGILCQDGSRVWTQESDVRSVYHSHWVQNAGYMWADCSVVDDVYYGMLAKTSGVLWTHEWAESPTRPVAKRTVVKNAKTIGFLASQGGRLYAPGARAEACENGFYADAHSFIQASGSFTVNTKRAYYAETLSLIEAWDTKAKSSGCATIYSPAAHATFGNDNGMVRYS